VCGIAGIYRPGGGNRGDFEAELKSMTETIRHRGPDDSGTWVDSDAGIGFGHRRLSIVDLSPLGRQPMQSAGGRYWITFNGEIYNYRDLKDELIALGHEFRSTSDTEVLLAAVEQWDVIPALKRFTGMFAFGLWDRAQRRMYLARDRFGEKPLYYSRLSGAVVFGSELKVVRKARGWSGRIDRAALACFVRLGYISAPRSIFENVRKVRAGHVLAVTSSGREFHLCETAYWDPLTEASALGLPSNQMSGSEAADQVECALSRSISRQMVADVPVGAFLSGGVDSSLTVALMQRLNSRPIKTFSIGFEDERYNEAPYAREVARHLGTDHTELVVTAPELLGVVGDLPRIYDEPFADSSGIPTYLVSRLARSQVTVSLSGDAADELFGGYGRYPEAVERWEGMAEGWGSLRRWLGQGALSVSREGLRRLLVPLAGVFTQNGDAWTEMIRDRSARWTGGTLQELYQNMYSVCRLPGDAVLGADSGESCFSGLERITEIFEPIRQLMLIDVANYLPDDILAKVDRAAMAVSLETRVPFLDPEVAQLAWSLPTGIHFQDGRGKWLLREILSRHVPRAMFERPKRGFAVPMARWLREDLLEWAQALLDPTKLKSAGFLNHEFVGRRWDAHKRGSADWSSSLWPIITFQAWLEEWGSG